MSSIDEAGETLRQARMEAGISLAKMAQLINYSKPYLGLVETGRRQITVDIVVAYENELGPIGDDMLRRDITHPRVLKAGKPTLTELAKSINDGEPGALINTPTSRTVDFFLAAKLEERGTEHLREWIRKGQTSTLRVNALAVLSKMSIESDIPLIIEALENDEKVRFLSLASEASKLMQYDWQTSLRVAKEPHTAPNARKFAKLLAKEAVNQSDAECRWCGSYLLMKLAPVLGK